MEVRHPPRSVIGVGILAEFLIVVFVGVFLLSIVTPTDLLGLTDTQYTQGFDRKQFRKIDEGDPASEVLKRLGEPYTRRKDWNIQQRFWAKHEVTIDFRDDVVTSVSDAKSSPTPGLTKGMTLREVEDMLGYSSRVEHVDYEYEYWSYSRSPSFSSYWQVYLKIDVKSDSVEEIRDSFYWD